MSVYGNSLLLEGLFDTKNSIIKSEIDNIVNRCSGEDSGSILRTCCDSGNVQRFISELKKSFPNIVFSRITHITGDYNYYTQSFAFVKNKTLVKFTVTYNNKKITFRSLSNVYTEVPLNYSKFDDKFILLIYSMMLPISYDYIYSTLSGLKISDYKISIMSCSYKLDQVYNRLKSSKYNVEIKDNGFKIEITP